MSKILKIFVAFLVSLSLITPFSVKAIDSVGTFFGEEIPISVIDQYGTSLIGGETNGYTYLSYIVNGSNEVPLGTDNSYTFSDTTSQKCFRLRIVLPELVDADTLLDVYGQVTHNGWTTISVYVIGIASDWSRTFESSGTVGSTSTKTSTRFTFTDLKSESSATKYLDIYIYGYNSDSKVFMNLNELSLTESSGTSQQLGQIMTWLEIINTNLQAINSNISVVVSSLKQAMIDGFAQVGSYITNQTLALENHITQSFNSLSTWITNQTNSINNKLQSLLGSNSNYNDDLNDANDKNDELSQDVNDYNELENGFHNDMNESLDNIDLNVDLITGNDFITTATFISTTMNRIVTSNKFYESFVITGLILGLALVMIGKKVI